MNVWYSFTLALMLAAAIFPRDLQEFILVLALKVRTLVLNCVLYLHSYLHYVKIIAELRDMGLDAPPFHFIPIEQRDQ
jgi:hypothetical protein